ncbi:MAG TPA: hypothetical protein VHS96_14035 [Bacteroidia bacterium]|nr:hypothetical protein [Bacteroidia bacterium]
MKVPKDIQAEVEATLNLAEGIARVAPSEALRGKILQRVSAAPAALEIPFYRSAGFAAAAAVVILVLNVATVVYSLRPTPAQRAATEQADRLAAIRSAYALDDNAF